MKSSAQPFASKLAPTGSAEPCRSELAREEGVLGVLAAFALGVLWHRCAYIWWRMLTMDVDDQLSIAPVGLFIFPD